MSMGSQHTRQSNGGGASSRKPRQDKQAISIRSATYHSNKELRVGTCAKITAANLITKPRGQSDGLTTAEIFKFAVRQCGRSLPERKPEERTCFRSRGGDQFPPVPAINIAGSFLSSEATHNLSRIPGTHGEREPLAGKTSGRRILSSPQRRKLNFRTFNDEVSDTASQKLRDRLSSDSFREEK